MKNISLMEQDLNHKQAVDLANEIARLEAVVKDMKNQLKGFVEANGPIETGDQIWRFNESISWKFKGETIKELMSMMALEGVNPWEMIQLPKRSLDKLGWGDDFLVKYGEKKVIKRFVANKL